MSSQNLETAVFCELFTRANTYTWISTQQPEHVSAVLLGQGAIDLELSMLNNYRELKLTLRVRIYETANWSHKLLIYI